jgi:hypothetical protein
VVLAPLQSIVYVAVILVGFAGIHVNPARLAVPPGVVTLTLPVDPEPTTAVIWVAEFTIKEEAAVPPKLTAVAPVKFVPVSVTVDPLPAVVGVNDPIAGAGLFPATKTTVSVWLPASQVAPFIPPQFVFAICGLTIYPGFVQLQILPDALISRPDPQLPTAQSLPPEVQLFGALVYSALAIAVATTGSVTETPVASLLPLMVTERYVRGLN